MCDVTRVRLTVVLLISVLFAIGCSSNSDDAGEEENPELVSLDGASGSIAEVGEPDWTGAPVNPFDLRAGDCYNEVSWIDEDQERRINITAKIDCAEPHDREVYFEEEFPAPQNAPFPGDVKMSEWSTELCYGAFSGFVGLEYELSIYGIDFLQPTKETFEHPVGRHRRVTCSLYDTTDNQVVGTARGSRL